MMDHHDKVSYGAAVRVHFSFLFWDHENAKKNRCSNEKNNQRNSAGSHIRIPMVGDNDATHGPRGQIEGFSYVRSTEKSNPARNGASAGLSRLRVRSPRAARARRETPGSMRGGLCLGEPCVRRGQKMERAMKKRGAGCQVPRKPSNTNNV